MLRRWRADFYVLESFALVVSFVWTVLDRRELNAKGLVLLFWGSHHGWCGVHAMRGAECFAAIKRTQGNDIDYLMDAVIIQKEYWKQLLVPCPSTCSDACVMLVCSLCFVAAPLRARWWLLLRQA